MRISIVTSTYNAATLLPYTINSLKQQTSDDFEWVVVDGASTDESVALVKAETSQLNIRLISEPDKGIYDAWNKACELFTGEWVLFLGAGDVLSSPSVIAAMAPILKKAYPENSIVYGNMVFLDETTRKKLRTEGEPWEKLEGAWELGRPRLPMHPATFNHRTLFSGRDSFDASYQIVGDSVFLLKHFERLNPLYVNVEISHMLEGGISTDLSRFLELRKEIKRCVREAGIQVPLMCSLITDINFYIAFWSYKFNRLFSVKKE